MTGRGTLVTADALEARIDALDDDLAAMHAQLARRADELEAARQINRELMARLNLERR